MLIQLLIWNGLPEKCSFFYTIAVIFALLNNQEHTVKEYKLEFMLNKIRKQKPIPTVTIQATTS